MNIQSVLKRHGIKSIWHFTDKSNLASIKKYGLLSLSHLLQTNIYVPCFCADDMSHYLDRQIGIDKFVHLSFVKDHPMYHVAKRDGRIPNPMWLEIDLSVLHEDNTLFSDEVANKRGASIFDANDLESMIDFDSILYERDFWKRKEARKAEIMVANNITLDDIRGVSNGY